MSTTFKSYKGQNILCVLVFLSILLLLIVAKPEDWFGVVLIPIILLFIFTQKVFLEDTNTLIAVLFVLSCKIIISLINNNYITLFGGEADAIGFVRRATFISENDININLLSTGSDLYENYLALVFNLTGVSKFSGEILSIFTFVISMNFLLKIARNLYGSRYNTYLVCLFSLLPSMMLYTSFTMREPYQILFFLMSIYYFILSLNKAKHNFNFIIKFLFSVIMMGILHNGLLAFAFIMTAIVINRIMKVKFNINNLMFRVVLVGLMLMFFVTILNLVGLSTPATDALLSGNAANYIEGYRDGGTSLDSRALYGVELDTSNLITVILTAPLVFINYMLAPFPWQISSLIDIYAILDNLFRLTLIFLSIKYVRKTNESKKDILSQILLLFFAMEILWSLGTVNWGTAIRHHLIAYGLILILGIPQLLDILRIKKLDNQPRF